MENKQTDNTTFDERIDEIMSNLWTKESPFGQVLQGDDEVKAQLQVLITKIEQEAYKKGYIDKGIEQLQSNQQGGK